VGDREEHELDSHRGRLCAGFSALRWLVRQYLQKGWNQALTRSD
jgi:hypothetical protein